MFEKSDKDLSPVSVCRHRRENSLNYNRRHYHTQLYNREYRCPAYLHNIHFDCDNALDIQLEPDKSVSHFGFDYTKNRYSSCQQLEYTRNFDLRNLVAVGEEICTQLSKRLNFHIHTLSRHNYRSRIDFQCIYTVDTFAPADGCQMKSYEIP